VYEMTPQYHQRIYRHTLVRQGLCISDRWVNNLKNTKKKLHMRNDLYWFPHLQQNYEHWISSLVWYCSMGVKWQGLTLLFSPLLGER
jgi:hypothetical protein